MPFYNQADTTISNFTWNTKPAANEVGCRQVFISDIGVNGSLWCSNGTTWSPVGSVLLKNSNKGFVIPSLAAADAATYSQSGTTLTVTCVGHTLVASLNGSDIYLGIGTPTLGVAPTAPKYANWFSNFTYIDANTFTCTAGNSQTGTGNILTNLAETYVTELEHTIKGGLLGANGGLATYCTQSRMSSANSKLTKQYYHTAVYHAPSRTTNSQSDRWYSEINTQNSEQFLVTPNSLYTGFVVSAGVANRYAIDTTVDRLHKVSMTLAAALEYQSIMQYRVELVR